MNEDDEIKSPSRVFGVMTPRTRAVHDAEVVSLQSLATVVSGNTPQRSELAIDDALLLAVADAAAPR
jgi:hypothetical protein|tara:strand:+ start:2448 stop:2648 length:201 start_codon:yes stop_codon:yes gene_type:complete